MNINLEINKDEVYEAMFSIQCYVCRKIESVRPADKNWILDKDVMKMTCKSCYEKKQTKGKEDKQDKIKDELLEEENVEEAE